MATSGGRHRFVLQQPTTHHLFKVAESQAQLSQALAMTGRQRMLKVREVDELEEALPLLLALGTVPQCQVLPLVHCSDTAEQSRSNS